MANVQRHRYGDPCKRKLAVDAAEVLEIGDLVFHDTNDVKPVSDFTYGASLLITQQNATRRFAGVALQAHAAADLAGNLVIATGGVHEFACASATFEVGDWVGIDDNAGGTALLAQQVIAVTDPRAAIGKVAERVGTAATSVLIEILPRVYGRALPQHVQHLSMYEVSGVAGAADILSDFTFGQQVKLVQARYISSVVQATADQVFTFKNGANSLDDTLTVATSGSACGKISTVTFADANAYDYFDADDLLDIASDGGGSAGAGTLIIDFIVL